MNLFFIYKESIACYPFKEYRNQEEYKKGITDNRIYNERYFDLYFTKNENVSKSFSLMCYVWDKLSDNSFPYKDYFDVITELDNKIENIKRSGIKATKISNDVVNNKVFLICIVREVDNKQKKWIENYVKEKELEGYSVHAPHMHTRQVDLFGGYAICRQNAEALASSSEVHIYYDKNSFGSVFYLGVAYQLYKPLKLLNEVNLDNDDTIDNIIINWPYNNKIKKKIKEPK